MHFWAPIVFSRPIHFSQILSRLSIYIYHWKCTIYWIARSYVWSVLRERIHLQGNMVGPPILPLPWHTECNTMERIQYDMGRGMISWCPCQQVVSLRLEQACCSMSYICWSPYATTCPRHIYADIHTPCLVARTTLHASATFVPIVKFRVHTPYTML